MSCTSCLNCYIILWDVWLYKIIIHFELEWRKQMEISFVNKEMCQNMQTKVKFFTTIHNFRYQWLLSYSVKLHKIEIEWK